MYIAEFHIYLCYGWKQHNFVKAHQINSIGYVDKGMYWC